MIDLNKPLEEVDYKVIPIKIIEDENAWQVEVLRGDHKDKKLVFTNIEYDGKKRSLKFLLNVVINNEALEKPTADLVVKKQYTIGHASLVDMDSIVEEADD